MRRDQDQVTTVPGGCWGCCVDYSAVASSSEVLCPAPAASCSTNDPNIPFQVDWSRSSGRASEAAPARPGKTCNKGGEGEMVLSDADTAANWPNGFSNTQVLFAVYL